MTQEPAFAPPSPNLGEDVVYRILLWLGALFTLPSAAVVGSAQLLQQKSLLDARSSLPDVSILQEALRRRSVSDPELANVLGRLGFSDRAQQIMRSVVPTLLDSGNVLELERRGVIDRSESDVRLADLGFGDSERARLRELLFFLPPVQDLITFMVREVFTPDIRQRFGQDEGFPEQALPLARRLGVRDEDMRAYWAAHWRLPSPEQGFAMLQRAVETGVTDAELDVLLRALDIMPYWRERLKQIAYNPITRVDIRRLHKRGLLDHAGLVDRYQRVGYNAADAELLAQWTEQQNTRDDDDELEPWRAGLRSHAQSLYQELTLTEDDLRAVLGAVGHTQEQVDAYVAESRFIRDSAQAATVRSAVRRGYVAGQWTAPEAVERLGRYGFGASESMELVNAWAVERELRALTDAEHAERDLTRADVLGAFADGVVQEAEARTALFNLGYSDSEASTLLARVELRQARERRGEIEAQVKTLYLARRIGAGEASSQLAQGGVLTTRIDALLTQWDSTLAGRAPMLSVAQVQAALRAHYLAPEEAAARLDAMGYDPVDRDVLMKLATGRAEP